MKFHYKYPKSLRSHKICILTILLSFVILLSSAFIVSLNLEQKKPPLHETIPVIEAPITFQKKESIDPNPFKTPSLDEIFDDQDKDLALLDKEKIVIIIATGDVIPARSVNFKMHRYNNFKYPFEKTADILSAADITLINLEAPLVENCPLTNEGMKFCGDKRFLEGLLFSGVDIANLANNHIGNYGQDGIEQTKNILTKNEILISGLDEITVKRVGETNFAFLGYNGVKPDLEETPWIEKDKIARDVKNAKAKADIVIVSFHWGKEYSAQPVADPAIAPFDPQDIAHFTIDSGADLIIGNHSHWIQGVEIYKNKLIVYSHGNFIFDQMWSQKTREGLIGKYTFFVNELIEVEFIPIIINDYSQPALLKDPEKRIILEEMKENSQRLM